MTHHKHTYAIQCSTLRNKPNGDEIWATMLCNAAQIDPLELLEHCDTDRLFDEGESYEDFVMSDDEPRCFKVHHPHLDVYFIQHSGFEFFFTADGKIPTYSEPLREIVSLLMCDSAARVLCPPRSALAGQLSQDADAVWVEEDMQFIAGIKDRFILYRDNKVVAGISVESGVVDTLFVHPDYRRQGLATALFNKAKNYLGDLEHSTSLTENGAAFVRSFNGRKHHQRELHDPSYG